MRSGSKRRASWFLGTAVVAVLLGSALACQSTRQPQPVACSGDAECAEGSVCRIARCRKKCPSDHWVGEEVRVKTKADERHATVSACDERIWVRYESGIEERVEADRVLALYGAQGRVKGDAK